MSRALYFVLGATLLAFVSPSVHAQGKAKWGLHKAYVDLRVVHRDLQTLKKGGFGGHRQKAIVHVDRALDHMRAAAKHYYGGKVPAGVLTAKLPPSTGKTSFKQLFEDARRAHRHLKEIKPGNYGGHRVKAIAELDKAIDEMKKAV